MTPDQYDVLERAIVRGQRVAIRFHGAELVIVPLSLASTSGREVLHTRQPTTGEPMLVRVDEIEALEALR